MLSLKTHNVLDYLIGAALALSPYLFGFAEIAAARNLFLVLGLGLIGYSLLTNYQYSIAKIIPLPMHMFMDVTAGIVLMLWPSLSGYRPALSGFQYALHFIFGLGAIGLVAFTDTRQPIPRSREERPELKRVA